MNWLQTVAVVIHVLLASTENSALTSDFLTYTVP